MGEDVYRDPQAQARAAELARRPKATLVNLALDARPGASRASLTKWHRQVLAWTITCAEHRDQAVARRADAPADACRTGRARQREAGTERPGSSQLPGRVPGCRWVTV